MTHASRLTTIVHTSLILWMLAWGVLPTTGSAASAQVFLVTKVDDTSDGVCDEDCSLREAIVAANATTTADTISLPAGLYSLSRAGINEDGGQTGDLDITQNVSISGAGMDATIIDGGALDRVVHLRGGASSSMALDGLTIQHGLATNGGGVLVQNGSSSTATFTMVRLRQNSATRGGGLYHGVSGNAGRTIFNTSIVEDNTATADGGGVFGGLGGISLLTGSVLRGNVAQNGNGGGAFNNGNNVTITNSSVIGNQAPNGSGGGLASTSTGFTPVTTSTIAQNTAGVAGGGAYIGSGTLVLVQSTLSTNSAPQQGGGIAVQQGGAVTVLQSTITNNSTPQAGGGLASNGGIVSLGRSLIASNTAGLGSDIAQLGGTMTSSGFNLIGNNETVTTTFGLPSLRMRDVTVTEGLTAAFPLTLNRSTDVVGTPSAPLDPRLGPLQDNGGLTHTHLPLAGSPAINAGEPTSSYTVDQRGVARVQGGSTDSGAVETALADSVQRPAVTIAYTTLDGTAVTGSDYLSRTGVITFTGAMTQAVILVPTIDDGVAEADETLAVVVQRPTNATVADAEGEGTITDNDAPPPTPTMTPVPPTETPTSTATATNTPVPPTTTPTSTATATNTPVPPTETPTSTATNTPVPPTTTPTATATATNTPVPPTTTPTATATATNTPVPPTTTPTATATTTPVPSHRLYIPVIGRERASAPTTQQRWLAALLRDIQWALTPTP